MGIVDIVLAHIYHYCGLLCIIAQTTPEWGGRGHGFDGAAGLFLPVLDEDGLAAGVDGEGQFLPLRPAELADDLDGDGERVALTTRGAHE